MRLRVLGLAMVLLGPAVAPASDLLPPGAPFPAWKLVDQTGAPLASTDLTGKSYLLWFYPKAMTPGCTLEGDGLRDQFAAFAALGVVILGVSFDPPAANAAFVRQQQFPFRLLSDTNRQLALAVGAATTPEQPAARRISYLVGSDGKVRQAYGTVTPSTHAQQVLGDLRGAPQP